MNTYEYRSILLITLVFEDGDLGDLNDPASTVVSGLFVVLLKYTLDISDGIFAGALIRNQSRLHQVDRCILVILPVMAQDSPIPHFYQFDSKFSVDLVQFV